MGQIIGWLFPADESSERSRQQIQHETRHSESRFEESRGTLYPSFSSQRDVDEILDRLSSRPPHYRSTYGEALSSISRSGNQSWQDGKIKLYHYTTFNGAKGIEREMLIRSSTQDTQPQHRRYGQGVYFTSYSPHDLEPDRLALNSFTHRGTVVTSPGIYHRTRYVVEIVFDAHEVERINVPQRSVYIYRGSIDLRNYRNRYRIYENPVNPYNNARYSHYLSNIGF